MPTDLQPPASSTEFSDILHALRTLTRDFLLGFRLEVGKLMLDRFYAGDLAAYRSNDPTKSNSFNKFTQSCATDLGDLGLSVNVLRQCINARATYDTLPQEVREKLLFTQVVALARLDDPTQRARLAMDATAKNWNVDQLKDAIIKANAGRYYDTDTTEPGTQPPAEPAAAESKGRKPGRVLVQFEQTVKDLQALRADWQAADMRNFTAAHRQRAQDVLVDLKAQVAEVEKLLALAPK